MYSSNSAFTEVYNILWKIDGHPMYSFGSYCIPGGNLYIAQFNSHASSVQSCRDLTFQDQSCQFSCK